VSVDAVALGCVGLVALAILSYRLAKRVRANVAIIVGEPGPAEAAERREEARALLERHEELRKSLER